MILGTGFAPFRGGPLRFAEHFGLKNIADQMEAFARADEKFVLCDLLKRHAREGSKFYQD